MTYRNPAMSDRQFIVTLANLLPMRLLRRLVDTWIKMLPQDEEFTSRELAALVARTREPNWVTIIRTIRLELQAAKKYHVSPEEKLLEFLIKDCRTKAQFEELLEYLEIEPDPRIKRKKNYIPQMIAAVEREVAFGRKRSHRPSESFSRKRRAAIYVRPASAEITDEIREIWVPHVLQYLALVHMRELQSEVQYCKLFDPPLRLRWFKTLVSRLRRELDPLIIPKMHELRLLKEAKLQAEADERDFKAAIARAAREGDGPMRRNPFRESLDARTEVVREYHHFNAVTAGNRYMARRGYRVARSTHRRAWGSEKKIYRVTYIPKTREPPQP